MENANVLIYCKDRHSMRGNENLFLRYKQVYLVSPDIGIREIVCEKSNVEFFPFDSDREGFYQETWEIIDKLNEVIELQKLKEPAYLYKGNCLIEGGFAQKIADVLYAINIFRSIIIEKRIDRLYCDRKCEDADIWALQAIAKSMNKSVYYLSGGIDSIIELKQWIGRAYYPGTRRIINFKGILDNLWNIIKNSKQCRKDKDSRSVIKQYDIGFILVFDTNKHINWLLNSLKSFSGKMNYCVFCMGADGARQKLQKMGYAAESVEKYYKARYIFQSIPDYVRDAHIIAKAVKKNVKCSFQDIDIRNIILDLYLRSLREEKLSNLIYEKIITAFLYENKVYLLTGNGDTNYISCLIFYHIVQKLGMNTMFYKDNTTLELLNVEKMVYEPYSNIMNFRFFSKGSRYLKALLTGGWKGKVYYFHDLLYYNVYKKYDKIVTEINEKAKVLWAPSYPTKGIYSIMGFLADNKFIIEECKNKDFDLYIKYHPNQDDSLIQSFFREAERYTNIYFINKQEAIEGYIEKADIIITTPSTVILDTALKKKLVICLVDSQRYQLVKHIEAGFIIKRQEELKIDKYVKMAMSRRKADNEYDSCLKRQRDFIKEFFEVKNNINDVLSDIIKTIKNGQ